MLVQRGKSVVLAARDILKVPLSYESLKTILFVYVLIRHTLKIHRHLRARGISGTVREIYQWINQRIVFLILQTPQMRQKVNSEMAKAKLDIEKKLIPVGPEVVRHLALPEEGRSAEWIRAEMDKMDSEMGPVDGWKLGKLSGAVYRESPSIQTHISSRTAIQCFYRRR
ncbi:hypothetical protein ONZ45_g17000 [Pleurotus djamor]|nr:hypothetical protein ONZ45_g17000 [Pleurotus djamor]